MRYGSVCSGIEAATQAWHPLGWTPAFFAEIETETETLIAVAQTLRGEWHDASEDGIGRQTLIAAYRIAGDGAVYHEGDAPAPLTTGTDPSAQVVAIQERAVSENLDAGPGGSGINADGAAYTLEARNKVQAVAFDLAQITSAANRSTVSDLASTLSAHSDMHIAAPLAVRRLTPREVDRLQGSADDYTRIPWRGKPAELCPDGPRYKAQGNGMSRNVLEWLGERIEAVDAMADQWGGDAAERDVG